MKEVDFYRLFAVVGEMAEDWLAIHPHTKVVRGLELSWPMYFVWPWIRKHCEPGREFDRS
jgi:hypothetical protein